MYIEMIETLGTVGRCYLRGESYEIEEGTGDAWIRAGIARPTDRMPAYIGLQSHRLQIGAGRPCVFPPALGEFGHLLMSHVPFVHHHPASHKTVCCRPGEEVLFPSADIIITKYVDQIPDAHRVSTLHGCQPYREELSQEFPDAVIVPTGDLSAEEELVAIRPDIRIPFRPLRRGLRADVTLGVRRRGFAPERNWPHWQQLAAAIAVTGRRFAVIGHRNTSFDLDGQACHSGDYDTDAAIELLQNCRLYVGQDSGNSHLAAAVGANMLLFRETAGGSRDLTPRMSLINPGRVAVMPAEAWNHPASVIANVLAALEADANAYSDQH